MEAPRNLGGRYEVGELIGRGGMAEVHIGHDTRLGRTVAIKILRSDLARDPSFQARFRREAQAAASLNHPAIVAVYDTGEDVITEHGGAVSHVPFIVMEYVEGHTVRDILRDGSAVPIEEAVEITAGVLSALEYSHHAGIVHRDIKPANVMLTPTGAVKVMDFGIARAMADSAGTMTQTQAVIGTAQYLSPEQARGEAVDSRSDLYSTGCLLFELLTGRPPFIGDSPVAVAYQHAREEAPAPSTFASDVPDALDRITVKALAKDREDRYRSAAEFRSDLENAIRGGHVSAPAIGALGAAALASDATAIYAEPATAATQVMGATPAATRVAPAAAMPWERDGGTAQHRPVPDDEEEERPRRRWLVWLLVVVGLLAAAGIVALVVNQGEEEPETVELIDLEGRTSDEARAWLEDHGLKFRPVSEETTEVEPGLVLGTDPPAGSPVELGGTVTVTLSAGPDAVEMPDLRNMDTAQAERALDDAGLGDATVTYKTENSISVDAERVTRSEPVREEMVSPDAEITIYLSTGQVTLPNLVELSREDAEAKLDELGLRPDVREEASADAEPGTVIRQDPGPGSVDQGSTVAIVVATEAPPEQTEVPDVFNLPQATAEERLGAANLTVRIEEVPDAEVEAGRAVGTDPPAGSPVDVGAEIVLYISSGPAAGEDGEGD